jgi:leader peptidase (prepilin peptidase)/N-methyltransferase
VALLAAVVGYALPDVRREPTRWHADLYRGLTAAGAALVVACLVVYGVTLEGIAACVFSLALVVVTATDIEYRLIPNRIVLPATAIVLACMTIAVPSPEWAIAAAGAGGLLLLFAFVYPAGMGMGDVKLALLMGAALGRSVIVALVIGMLASLVPSLVLLARHGRAGLKMGFPFGPFLAAGSVAALFLHAS